MSPDVPGKLLILFAFALNVLAGLSFLAVARGHRRWESLGRTSYHLFTIIVALAVAHLFQLFITHDFAFAYVYGYSDSTLPFFYIISSFWAGQEGTYLLWLFMTVLFGYALLRGGEQYRNYGMALMALVNSFFLFLLLKISPFALLEFHAHEGAGLNPLLQDPWMVIHPPVIFVGYAVAAIPFALALSALITNDYSRWVRLAFPWVALSALMLAAGNILGGYWAYKTLGWGGFWAWDPVENSSFVPWFASLALLHGLILEQRTGAMRRTNLLMAAGLFVLVVYGTFLTRSGVLADFSVHSFVDLGVNVYLVGFLLLFTGLTLALFFWRTKGIESAPLNYNFFGREFSLFSAMTLLSLFAGIVLVWTSLPLITSILSTDPRAAGLETYNGFAFPFAIVYALLLAVSPFQNFAPFTPGSHMVRKLSGIVAIGLVLSASAYFFLSSSLEATLGLFAFVIVTGIYFMKPDLARRLVPAVVAFVVTLFVARQLGVREVSHLLFFAAAAMAVVSNVVAFVGHLPGRWRLAGGHLAHLGFGFMIMGILGSSAFASSQKLILPRGTGDNAFGRSITYMGMENDIGFPQNELILSVDDGSGQREVRPQLYYSKRLDGLMKRPHVDKTLFYDIYYSPERLIENESSEGLVLKEGEIRNIKGFTIAFVGFDMGEHDQGKDVMRVEAQLTIEDPHGDTITIFPALEMQKASGEFKQVSAAFGHDPQYHASIEKILADQNAVLLSIPGLVEVGASDKLVLDVSKKPAINFLWLGTTFIMLGCAVVFVRRKSEQLL